MNTQPCALLGYTGSYLSIILYLVFLLPHRYNLKRTLGLNAALFFALLGLDYLRFFVYVGQSSAVYPLVTLLQTLLVQLCALLLSNYRDLRTIFVGVCAASYAITGSVLGMIAQYYTNSAIANAVVCLVTDLAICAAVIHFVGDAFRNVLALDTAHWGGLCLLPVLFYLTFYVLAYYPVTLNENPGNILAALLFLITMLASDVVMLKYLSKQAKERAASEENAVLSSYAKGLASQNRLVAESAQETRILRHDMRHYLGSLSVLLEQKNYDELGRSLAAFGSHIDAAKVEQYCDNVVINSVLYSKIAQAKTVGVEVHVSASIPQSLPVDEFELAAVIANLLENATQAASLCPPDKRQVRLMARTIDNKLLIEVANSFVGHLTFGTNGLPLSLKGKEHGFGTQSVVAFTRKNNAVFDCFAKGQQFTARLLLQNESFAAVS